MQSIFANFPSPKVIPNKVRNPFFGCNFDICFLKSYRSELPFPSEAIGYAFFFNEYQLKALFQMIVFLLLIQLCVLCLLCGIFF